MAQLKRQRDWYRAHPEKKSARTAKAVVRRRELIDTMKWGQSCIKCGETHPACLDYHHRDPSQKLFQLSSVRSVAKMIAEIAKCDVLCANCHRKLHDGENRAKHPSTCDELDNLFAFKEQA